MSGCAEGEAPSPRLFGSDSSDTCCAVPGASWLGLSKGFAWILPPRARSLRHEDERQILATLHRHKHSCDYGPGARGLDCFTGRWRLGDSSRVFAVEGLPLKRFQGQAELAELFASFEHALTKHRSWRCDRD